MEKVLWVVNYSHVEWFLERAEFVRASIVAIRTDNDVAKAIPLFHAKGIQVYGWRWPSAHRDPCLKEAQKAASLFGQGLDGYYVDPEQSDPKGLTYDWNQVAVDDNRLDKLAEDFCRIVTTAAAGKPFGITSHAHGKEVFAELPWGSFFKFSTVFLPQTYWRNYKDKVIRPGTPKENYRIGIDRWVSTGAPRDKIEPMAGEIAHVTAAEIAAYAEEAAAQRISRLHFYTATTAVKDSVWSAIAAAG